MVAQDLDIWNKAGALREAIIDLYLAEGIDLPERRVITEGIPAFDCMQLAIEVRRVFRGVPGGEGKGIDLRCAGIRTGEFHVWIVRCTSTPNDDGTPPSVPVIEGLALPIIRDAWVLPVGLAEKVADETLGVACDDILIGNVDILEPQGGFGGVHLGIEWLLGS